MFILLIVAVLLLVAAVVTIATLRTSITDLTLKYYQERVNFLLERIDLEKDLSSKIHEISVLKSDLRDAHSMLELVITDSHRQEASA